MRKISPPSFDENYEIMEKNVKKGNYKGAMKKAREIRKAVKSLIAADKGYRKSKKKFKIMLAKARSLKVQVEDEQKVYGKIKELYRSRDITSAKSMAEDTYRELKKRVARKEQVKDAFSHAKLVLSNARDYGVDITGSRSRYDEAKAARGLGDIDKALELLAKSVQEAERLKKQITRKKKRR